ncbi:MAG: LysM domain-containing protein [Rubrobacteraceae bacterium]
MPYIFLVRDARATYRRRRLGALLVAAILAFALYAGGNAGAESPTIHHTVDPGETLWEITVEHYPPTEDPRPIIEEIRGINGLGDYDIQAGMALELPPVE